jgi:hypothetical protein
MTHPNKGKRFPPEVLTREEIRAILAKSAKDTKALMWRLDRMATLTPAERMLVLR